MSGLTSRVSTLRQSPHTKRLMKYAAVSVISTVVTQSVLFLTYDVWTVSSAMACNIIATAVATVPAYWLNRTWTWGKRGRSSAWREIAPFWIISFVGLVLSTVAVGIAAHNADQISHLHVVRTLFVQFANLFTYGCIWIGRYTIFNKFLFGPETQGGAHRRVVVPGEAEAMALEEHVAHEHGAAATAPVPVPVEDPGRDGTASGPGVQAASR